MDLQLKKYVYRMLELHILRERRQMLRLSLSAIAVLTVGCGKSGPPKPEPLEVSVEALRDDVGSLRFQLDELKDKVAEFSDGSTDWKDIVGDVQSKVEEVDSKMSEVERSTSLVADDADTILNPQEYDDRDY